jgi:hypothetical protein
VKLTSKADREFGKQISRGLQPKTIEKINRPVPNVPKKQKQLTTQEWKFVNEFVAGDGHVTLREAVVRAGWPEKNAKRRAEDLTDPDKNPHIVAAIQKMRAEMAEKYGTTYERHMREPMALLSRLNTVEARPWARSTSIARRSGTVRSTP